MTVEIDAAVTSVPRTRSDLIDATECAIYDLSTLSSLLHILNLDDLPPHWNGAFKHIRDSIGRIDSILADRIWDLQMLERGDQ